MTTIEKVVDALKIGLSPTPMYGGVFYIELDFRDEHFTELARAILHAIREPSDEMARVGDDYILDGNYSGGGAWSAMVDAALGCRK